MTAEISLTRWSGFATEELELIDISFGIAHGDLGGEALKALATRLFSYCNGQSDFHADPYRWTNFNLQELKTLLESTVAFDVRHYYFTRGFTAKSLEHRVLVLDKLVCEIRAEIKNRGEG